MRDEPPGGREREARGGISKAGRARLEQYMEEGLGDHILYLRIYQVLSQTFDSAFTLSRKLTNVLNFLMSLLLL